MMKVNNKEIRPPLNQEIYQLVKQIPRGKVATYGQIAALIGRCSARQVGFAMAATPVSSDIPWQRVINSQGKVSPRAGGDGANIQRKMLEIEGLVFDKYNKVSLKVYGWSGPDDVLDPDEFDERTLF